jgi:hypothetical protein
MENNQSKTILFIRIGYGLFVAISLYHLIFNKNYIDAATSLGIGLIFDPFDQSVSWNIRPKWQQAWLIVHLILMILLFGIGIFK